jgi:hypothetical protein
MIMREVASRLTQIKLAIKFVGAVLSGWQAIWG